MLSAFDLVEVAIQEQKQNSYANDYPQHDTKEQGFETHLFEDFLGQASPDQK